MNQFNPDLAVKNRTINSIDETLQDIRDRVSETPVSNRRRDATSALDSTSRLFGKPLSSIRARMCDVTALLASKNAAELGVSEKPFQNIRAEAMRALRAFA